MTKTQDSLRDEGTLNNWKRQGLVSKQGRINRDYFARGRHLIEVRYDNAGRVCEAFIRATSLSTGDARVLNHLSPRDPDKVRTIVGWLQA